MTTATPSDVAPELHLGRDVVRRLRLPGPPLGRPLPSRIGSLASSVSRFAAATSRPIDVRRALAGPGPRGLDDSSAPPRWWTPAPHEDAAEGAPAAPAWLAPARPVAIRRLPERGLPRAAREVPDETTWSPGGILGGLRGEVARVRRLDEVAAVGPMLTQTDHAKLNAGVAAQRAQRVQHAQQTQQAQHTHEAQQVTRTTAQAVQPSPQAPVRRATRSPRVPTGSSPPASEPPTVRAGSTPTPSTSAVSSGAASPATARPAPPDPASGAQATVPVFRSVAGSPPVDRSTPAAPVSGAQATVPAPQSVASAPPVGTTGAAGGTSAPLRRVARPSWQLRAERSRFEELVRRTPAAPSVAARPSAPSTPAVDAPPSRAAPVTALPTADRHRPAGTDPVPTPVDSALRPTETLAPTAPGLIAAGTDAPAALRRQAWSAGSVVLRQAAGARAQAASLGRRPDPAPLGQPGHPVVRRLAAAPATSTTSTTSPPSTAPSTAPFSAPFSGPAAATPAAAPVASSGASAGVAGPGPSSPAAPTTDAPADLRRMPRLWRRASEIRPATDVRAAVPAPVVRLAADAPAASPSTSAPTSGPDAATTAPAALTSVPAPVAATPITRSTTPSTTPFSNPSTPTSTPPSTGSTSPATSAAQVRRYPASRVGAHIATPTVARSEVAMPELLSVHRFASHGSDPSRALATGFAAPETIRPAGSPAAAATPVAAAGEHRLWRRTPAPAGSVSPAVASTAPSSMPAAPASVGATATAAASSAPAVHRWIRRTPAGAAHPSPRPPTSWTSWTSSTAPTAPAALSRTWQPWSDAPTSTPPTLPTTGPTTGRATPTTPTTTPATPTTPASRPVDVRRFTVAPPRISIAPQQPAPPVPAVARTATGTPAPGTAPTPVPDRPPDLTIRRTSSGQSLVDATAHLFGPAEPVTIRRAIEGDAMSNVDPPLGGNLPALRGDNTPDNRDSSGSPTVPPTATFEAIVDAVVQRIERRVVDELERRGRYDWGGR